jgi:hypothetical protein
MIILLDTIVRQKPAKLHFLSVEKHGLFCVSQYGIYDTLIFLCIIGAIQMKYSICCGTTKKEDNRFYKRMGIENISIK